MALRGRIPSPGPQPAGVINVNSNPTLIGATAGALGSGGTWPDGWTSSVWSSDFTTEHGTFGVSYTLSNIGVDPASGYPSIDIQLSGPTVGTTASIAMDIGRSQNLIAGNTYTASYFVSLVGGALTNITSIQIQWDAYNDSAYLSTAGSAVTFTPTAALQRVSSTGVMPATGNCMVPIIIFTFSNGVTVTPTLRVQAVQSELGGAPSSFNAQFRQPSIRLPGLLGRRPILPKPVWTIESGLRLSAAGFATSAGNSAGTFLQTTLPPDPWGIEFSTDFGPPDSSAPPFDALGQATSAGRAAIAAAKPLSAAGLSKSTGRGSPLPAGTLSAKGASKATGRSAGTFVQATVITSPWSRTFTFAFGPLGSTAAQFNASGTAKGLGRAGIAGTLPLTASGRATAKGRVGLTSFKLASSRGSAQGQGRVSTGSSTAVLTGRGRASAKAAGLALYTVPPQSIWGSEFSSQFGPVGGTYGRAQASGRATLTAEVLSLTATGTARAAGNALSSPPDRNILIGAGTGQASGAATTPMAQAANLQAQAAAASRGAGRTGLAQPITAKGVGTSRGSANPQYNAFLSARGIAQADATLDAPTNLTIALTAAGRSLATAGAGLSASVALANRGTSRSTGLVAISAAQPVVASGLAQATGQLGGVATQHLRGTGRASAAGASRILAATPLSGRGVAVGDSIGSSRLFVAQPLSVLGRSAAAATLGWGGATNLAAIGTAVGHGTTDRPFVAADLEASGASAATGLAGVLTQQANLVALGTGASSGQFALPTGSVALVASGFSIARGTATTSSVSLALTARGRSGSAGSAQSVNSTPLTGIGVGLSSGRIAAIATTLLQGSGRGRADGQAAVAAAVGFQARSKAETRGYLSSVLGLHAGGLGQSSGRGRVTGYYNVTPDTPGPRLSTLTSLPAFDAMDLGDTDFFSWDWSGRASVLGDPILSATVTATPSTLPVGPVTIVGNIVQVRVGTAAIAETFSLRCTVTLRSGRILHWSALVPVEDF